MQLLEQLDNAECGWDMPSLGGNRRRPSHNTFPPAANEVVVRDCVIQMAGYINGMALAHGFAAVIRHCRRRSRSFADLVIRSVGAVSNHQDISKYVLGVGAVKHERDFELQRGEGLENALQDPQRAPAIIKAVQEVCTTRILPQCTLAATHPA